MFGELGNLMKMQSEIRKIQKSLKKMESVGISDDALASITVNGEFEIVNVKIDEDVLKTADKRQIEKAVTSAYNKAAKSNKEASAAKMKELTGGMKIPGLDGLF